MTLAIERAMHVTLAYAIASPGDNQTQFSPLYKGRLLTELVSTTSSLCP
jgi:hypothetical protein